MRAPAKSHPDDVESKIGLVRRFNRFYTRAIGTLNEGLLNSPFSLTEVRVLYELAHGDPVTATDIRRELGIDNGYLSRMLADFEKRGLIKRSASASDARRSFIALTARGRKQFGALDQRQDEEVRKMLERLSAEGRSGLVLAMESIAALLGAPHATADAAAPYILRGQRAGDLGWVVERHGALYTKEYGWDWRFEAYVARIIADFVDHFDPQRERCWIAERDAQNVGCVFVVNHPEQPSTAKLRMLLVEPSARGLGLGKRLVDECTRFAREVGYSKIVLFTCSVLHTARHVYEQAGYRKTHEEPDPLFKPGELAERWELKL